MKEKDTFPESQKMYNLIEKELAFENGYQIQTLRQILSKFRKELCNSIINKNSFHINGLGNIIIDENNDFNFIFDESAIDFINGRIDMNCDPIVVKDRMKENNKIIKDKIKEITKNNKEDKERKEIQLQSKVRSEQKKYDKR